MDYFAAMSAFVRTVELGSFSKAAEALDVKVSTVSRHVSGLEEDLRAALFNRSTRRLHLTEAGKTFHAHAVQVLAELEQARSATMSLNARPQGVLRINVPSAFGRRHIVPHLKDFVRDYPDIKLDVTLTDLQVDLIETGTDVAVRIGALADSGLIATKLAPQRRVLVAAPSYLGYGRKPPSAPEDLAGHDCLAFALQPSGTWHYRASGDPDQALESIAVAGHLRANDSDALHAAAVAGMGIALLPTWQVWEELREGTLVQLLQDWEWFIAPGAVRAIWGIYPPKKVVAPKVAAFIEFFKRTFGQPAYWDK